MLNARESDRALEGVGVRPSQRQRISPDNRVCLKLTDRERNLIIEEMLMLDPNTEKRLRLAPVEGEHLVLRLTLDDFEELQGNIAAVANHTKSKRLKKELDAVWKRIQTIMDTYTDQDE